MLRWFRSLRWWWQVVITLAVVYVVVFALTAFTGHAAYPPISH